MTTQLKLVTKPTITRTHAYEMTIIGHEQTRIDQAGAAYTVEPVGLYKHFYFLVNRVAFNSLRLKILSYRVPVVLDQLELRHFVACSDH